MYLFGQIWPTKQDAEEAKYRLKLMYGLGIELQARKLERDRAARDRAIIERLCRKKHFREKYQAMGLWPLPAVA